MTKQQQKIYDLWSETYNRIMRGKGIWQEPGYITDDCWQRLIGKEAALSEVLEILGVDKNDSNL